MVRTRARSQRYYKKQEEDAYAALMIAYDAKGEAVLLGEVRDELGEGVSIDWLELSWALERLVEDGRAVELRVGRRLPKRFWEPV